jgi:hypothetical protein
MTQVVLESFSVQQNEQDLSLKVFHVNLLSFQYVRVVFVKVLIDPSKY